MDKKNIIVIIPARGGSKRIPRKNIKILCGKPLIAYTIESALKSKYIDRVVVSTDSDEIAEISKKYGSEVVKRPKKISGDKVLVQLAIEYTLRFLQDKENYKADIIILLQPTSPLRNSVHIDKAVEEFIKRGYDSLLSVAVLPPLFIWKIKKNNAIPVNFDLKKVPMSQDKEFEYKDVGAIYITKKEIIFKKHNVLGGKIGLYLMEEKDSIDIDSEDDFTLCENILRAKNN